MEGRRGSAAGYGCRWWRAGEERLDRALVAGLLLDAALAASPWPPDLETRGRVLKTRVQEDLLDHLAGRVTLDCFRGLIHTLDHAFSFYFPLLSSLLQPPEKSPPYSRAAAPATRDAVPGARAVRADLLSAALGRMQKILPHRTRSKLTRPKLQDFLEETRGAGSASGISRNTLR